MPITYVTGPAGAGKSTVAIELQSQGIEAYDGDGNFCGWYSLKTNQKVPYPQSQNDRAADWENHHSFRFDEALVKQLFVQSKNKTVFICGNAMGNDLEIAAKYFSKVICLTLPEQVMVQRVTTRTNNRYGNDPDELAIMKRDFQATFDRYKDCQASFIDADRSVKAIADDIVRLAT